MKTKLVRIFLVVSLLTMGLLLATPTPTFACHGRITIVKDTDPDGGAGFNFSGDLGSFTLNDDQSETFYKSGGWYNVTESVPSGWDLDSVACTGGDYETITNGVKVHLESEGQHITCTFTNKEIALEMEKTSAVSDAPIMPGSTITYTIVVSNPASSGSQTNIVISDTLPTGTSYVPGSTQVTVETTVFHKTVRDEFKVISYGNNNGSVNWSGDWQEIGDDGNASSGRIRIVNERLRFREADHNDGIKRSADLSGATSAHLSFDWYKEDCEEDISVYVSADGSSFDLLDTFTGKWTGDSESYDISAYASANTTVRFQNVAGNWSHDNDVVFFDNVQIEFWKRETSTAPGGDPPNLAAGYSLLPGDTMTVTFQVTVDNPIPEGLTQIVNAACVTSDQVPDPNCDTTTDPIRTCCIGATSITFKNVSSGNVDLWFYEGTHVDHPNAPYDPAYFAHFDNVPPQGTITLNASVYFPASGYFPEYIYNYGSGCHWGWDIQLICDDPASLAVGNRSPDGGGGQKLEVMQVVWEGDCECQPGDMDGAATLVRTDNKVYWDITNNSSNPLIITMIELNWPSGNGNLKTVKLDGATIFNQQRAPTYAMIDSGWAGTLADRTIEVGTSSRTETLEFEFENLAGDPTLTEPYRIGVQCFGQGCYDDVGEGSKPTVITLSSFAARSGAGGLPSGLWPRLVGLTILATGSLFGIKRWAG